MTLLPSQLQPAGLAHPPALIDQLQIQLGAAGSDPQDPNIVSLCFDDSGSLALGNDPVGARYQEARRALEHIVASTRTDKQQVAIFRFDHLTVPPIGPLALNNKAPRKALLRAIEPPKVFPGSSVLTPAMQAMNQLAKDYEGANNVAVIFSDFELLDQLPSQPFNEIAAFPGIVHAVVMNRFPPDELVALPNVLITRVSAADPPGMLAAALAHSLTLHRSGATRPHLGYAQ